MPIFSPLSLAALLVNAIMFAAFFWLATASVRGDIAFIERELAGIEAHALLMQRYKAMPSDAIYTQMRDVGDSSNLILDPELGSYYLVNLMVQLIPDALQVLSAKEPLSFDRVTERVNRSISVAAASGVATDALRRMVGQIQPESLSGEQLSALYDEASTLLEARLVQRQEDERASLHNITLIVLGLWSFSSFLIVVSAGHYRQRSAFREAKIKLAMLHQLEKANAELEHFSYFMAHDLKEPVRTMRCFATLLAQELPLSDGSEAAHYTAVIEQSSARMAQLIEAILEFVACGKTAAPDYETIELLALVRAIEHDVQMTIDESQAQITCATLPQVVAPAMQLRRVLQNLMLNAMQYRHPHRRPAIHISAQPIQGGWEIAVEDNGLGFDAALAKQAFEPFRRLHSESVRKGSGIGLSICKKLVEGWGGTINAISQEGIGSRFVFTIMQPADSQR